MQGNRGEPDEDGERDRSIDSPSFQASRELASTDWQGDRRREVVERYREKNRDGKPG